MTLAVQAGAADSHSTALTDAGGVLWWGNATFAEPPAGLSSVKGIGAGGSHNLAILSDDSVLGWGDNTYGQTTIPSGLGVVASVSAGVRHSLALRSDGSVAAWGDNAFGQTAIPSGIPSATAISAGTYSCAAVHSDGTVTIWGDIPLPPSPLSNAQAVSLGDYHGAALLNDGTVTCWGNNTNGEATPPAGLSGVIAVSAGTGFTIALKNDGTLVGWGADGFGQSSPPGSITSAVRIDTGASHGVAVTSAGDVLAWGRNTSGQTDVPVELSPESILLSSLDFSVIMEGQANAASPDGTLDASIEFSANLEGSRTATATISAELGFPASFTGVFDWLSLIPATEVQEVYRLVITGAPNSLEDLIIGGISSWQATNQAGNRSAYLQAVIPGASAILDAISSRQAGELVIYKGVRFFDGSERYEEILRSNFDTFRYDRGPRSLTATVSGYMANKPIKNGTRALESVRSLSLTNGKYRARCDIDLFLQPGMIVTTEGVSFTADYINYYVAESDKFCEVSER